MKNAWKYFAASLAVLFGVAVYGSVGGHVGPQAAYPNATYTPGVVATTDYKELTSTYGGQTYSQSNRNVTQATKNAVCAEYPANCKGVKEIDHFCPLALGCSNDIKNLWAEPEHIVDAKGNDWGFHTKDKLETYLVIQMKAGKIAPSDAQQCIIKDWVACYLKYFPSVSKGFGSVVEAADPDDEVIN